MPCPTLRSSPPTSDRVKRSHMGQFSVEIPTFPGSVLSGNQQLDDLMSDHRGFLPFGCSSNVTKELRGRPSYKHLPTDKDSAERRETPWEGSVQAAANPAVVRVRKSSRTVSQPCEAAYPQADLKSGIDQSPISDASRLSSVSLAPTRQFCW